MRRRRRVEERETVKNQKLHLFVFICRRGRRRWLSFRIAFEHCFIAEGKEREAVKNFIRLFLPSLQVHSAFFF